MSEPATADQVPGTTIRFFLSSTFVDFQVERDVLQRRVFPELRRLCAAAGFRLQPIDLRWGVSEAAGTDRQTLRICFDELERCRRLSPDLFLLIQLGERYGSYILPPQVPAALVERLLPHLAPDEREAFDAAYRLDENAVPPEYVLLRADSLPPRVPARLVEDLLPHLTPDERERFAAAYRPVEHAVPAEYSLLQAEGRGRAEDEALRHALVRAQDEALRQALVRAGQAARVEEADRLLFEGSATHREIQLGMLGQPPGAGQEAGVLCAVRRFAGDRVGPAAARFATQDAERAATVRRLTDAVLDRLPAEQVRRYDVTWDGERGPAFDEEALAEAYLGLLRPKLDAVIAARTAAREAAAARGRDEAALANAAFEAERLAHFVGREGPLAAIDAYLDAPAAVPLVLAGPGGSGKSTLLARVAEGARAAHPGALLLKRYVGVTPGAESLRTLLDGLRAELAAAYGQEIEPVREDFERARAFRAALAWATSERPLVLLVDALDQLSPPPVPTDWLPEALPPHVHLIVSVLDEPDRPEFASLQERQPAPMLVSLARMDAAEGDALLSRWLSGSSRTLQPAQRAAVLAAFAPEGRPLHLRLAFEEARSWRSFDDAATLPSLDLTIPGLVTTRFRRLERRDAHGPVLTGHTLGLLRAAKNGLAEDELLALLSRDAAVRRDLRRQSPSSPPIAPELPLPVALWARLYADLGPYLTEREADGARLLTYYHRQLAEVAAGRYLRGAKGRVRHRELARYFETEPLLEGAQPNLRKLSEQPTQEAAAGLNDELQRTLTDVGFIEQSIAYQQTAGALADLALLPDAEPVRQLVWTLSAGAVVLDQKPDELLNQVTGRVGHIGALHHLPEHTPRFQLRASTLAGDPSTVGILQGHSGEVLACAFSPHGRMALSASTDRTLRLWDVASGRTLRVLDGHTAAVRACAFSPDGRMALSASDDETLRTWDVASGRTLRVLDGHVGGGLACAFSPDGRTAQSGSRYGTLRLWDIASGQALRVLEGYSGDVGACAFGPDGRLALFAGISAGERTLRLWDVATGRELQRLETGAHDSEVVHGCALSSDGRFALCASGPDMRLWDMASGRRVRKLVGHTSTVFGCAFSPDRRLALSASGDDKRIGLTWIFGEYALRVWDVASGAVVRVLRGHTDTVYGCAFSPDGRLALSASGDHTLRLWDMESPAVAHVQQGHTNEVTSCAFSPDGRTALSGSLDGTLRLWDVASGRTVRVLEAAGSGVHGCAVGPDGRLALSASASTLQLWDLETGRTVRERGVGTADAVACALSPDGLLALYAYGTYGDFSSREPPDGHVYLWDVSSDTFVGSLGHYTFPARACAFSPDGRFALSASYSDLQLWDVASGRAIRVLKGHDGVIHGCAFSPDGRLALSASGDNTDVVVSRFNRPLGDYTLRVWDVASGAVVRVLRGHTDTVYGCAFSPDGRLALSASGDHTLRLWDVASGEESARWLTDGILACCAFAPVGLIIGAGDRMGGMHFLDLVLDPSAQPLWPSTPLSLHGTEGNEEPELYPARTHQSIPLPPTTAKQPAKSIRSRHLRWWPFGRRRQET